MTNANVSFAVVLTILVLCIWNEILASPANDAENNNEAVIISGFKKTHFILDVTPIRKVHVADLRECLELCLQEECKSVNYGNGECSLLTTVYCESDITQKALRVQEGFVYHEISSVTYSANCAKHRIDREERLMANKECVTDGKHGKAPEGTKCRFPFTYNGVTYEGCSHAGWNETVGWCSTDQTTSHYNKEMWGSCSSDCPTDECVTDGKHGNALEGTKCQFPFYYQGVRYDGCSYAGWNITVGWCSTDQSSPQYNKDKWGSCSSVCPTVNEPIVLDTECVTDGKHGKAPAATKCRFPFTYRGVTYERCIYVGWNETVAWCSTDQARSEYNSDKWGSCSSDCPKSECVTNGYYGNAPKGTKCQFPFTYNNVTYEGCTYAGWNKTASWCSTDQSSSEYNKDMWGSCNYDCPRDVVST